MPKLVKQFFKKLRYQALFIKRFKKITRVKNKLRQNLQKMQEGQTIQADLKEMRVMSKLLRRSQYGTTKHPHDPLKLDLNNRHYLISTHHRYSHHHKNDTGLQR